MRYRLRFKFVIYGKTVFRVVLFRRSLFGLFVDRKYHISRALKNFNFLPVALSGMIKNHSLRRALPRFYYVFNLLQNVCRREYPYYVLTLKIIWRLCDIVTG